METIEDYWNYKRNNAKSRKIHFELTLEDMKYLFDQAGITPDQIGMKSTDWCLARDDGNGNVDGDLPYSIGTCKFKTRLENLHDSHKGKRFASGKRSDESRARISESKKGHIYLRGTKLRKVECPHCGGMYGFGNGINRHMKSCKNKSKD